LFIHSEGTKWNHTAVGDIIGYGIPKEKIVIGKPVTKGDATNTGWIEAADLGAWSKRA